MSLSGCAAEKGPLAARRWLRRLLLLPPPTPVALANKAACELLAGGPFFSLASSKALSAALHKAPTTLCTGLRPSRQLQVPPVLVPCRRRLKGTRQRHMAGTVFQP